jgi:hypothetical protein
MEDTISILTDFVSLIIKKSLLAPHGPPSSLEIRMALSGELGHLVWRGPCVAMRVYRSIPPQLVPEHYVF